MMNRIMRLFFAVGVSVPEGRGDGDGNELHLAAAALLAKAAMIDDSFDAAEREAMTAVICKQFDLSGADGAALVEAAEKSARDSNQLVNFTRVIKDHYTPEERIELIEMIWEVVYADGVLHDYEDSLLRRIAGLIYVSDRDRGEARKRVLARLDAADP